MLFAFRPIGLTVGTWFSVSLFVDLFVMICAAAKGRLNTELREKFILPEGASQSRVSFVPRRSSLTSPLSSTYKQGSFLTGVFSVASTALHFVALSVECLLVVAVGDHSTVFEESWKVIQVHPLLHT